MDPTKVTEDQKCPQRAWKQLPEARKDLPKVLQHTTLDSVRLNAWVMHELEKHCYSIAACSGCSESPSLDQLVGWRSWSCVKVDARQFISIQFRKLMRLGNDAKNGTRFKERRNLLSKLSWAATNQKLEYRKGIWIGNCTSSERCNCQVVCSHMSSAYSVEETVANGTEAK